MTIIQAIKQNKELIKTWVTFRIEATYIDTKIGIFWIILQPILMTLIYSFAFGSLIGRAPRGGAPFVIFFLAGTSVWQQINGNWMKSGHLVVRNIGLLSQVKVAPIILAVVQIVESLIEFIINLIILILASALYGYFPNIMYLFLPLVLVFIIIFTTGGVLFVSTMGVYIRDIPNIVSMIMRLLFFLSGVIITPDMIKGTAGDYLKLNPILTMIESIRDIVIYAQAPTILSLVYMGAFALLSFTVGHLVFRRYQGTFVDYK